MGVGRDFQVVVNPQDMGGNHDCEIIKFHGDFSNPQRTVLSESDYEFRIRLEDELDLKLRSDMLGATFLFIGYSFRDPNISYLFRLWTDRYAGKNPNKKAVILLSNPSDFEKTLYDARNFEIISILGLSKDEFIGKLLERLSEY
jgi:hypothetical protein